MAFKGTHNVQKHGSKVWHQRLRVAPGQKVAAGALLDGNPDIRGQCYFITDAPGSNFFVFFDGIIEAAGYRLRPKNLWLPRRFAFTLGVVSEFFAFLVRPLKRYTPKMSRFAVTYTCTDYTFTSEKARKDFNFIPKYTKKEAFDRTVNFFKKHKWRNFFEIDMHSPKWTRDGKIAFCEETTRHHTTGINTARLIQRTIRSNGTERLLCRRHGATAVYFQQLPQLCHRL